MSCKNISYNYKRFNCCCGICLCFTKAVTLSLYNQMETWAMLPRTQDTVISLNICFTCKNCKAFNIHHHETKFEYDIYIWHLRKFVWYKGVLVRSKCPVFSWHIFCSSIENLVYCCDVYLTSMYNYFWTIIICKLLFEVQ